MCASDRPATIQVAEISRTGHAVKRRGPHAPGGSGWPDVFVSLLMRSATGSLWVSHSNHRRRTASEDTGKRQCQGSMSEAPMAELRVLRLLRMSAVRRELARSNTCLVSYTYWLFSWRGSSFSRIRGPLWSSGVSIISLGLRSSWSLLR
jgi:hypothetical protein